MAADGFQVSRRQDACAHGRRRDDGGDGGRRAAGPVEPQASSSSATATRCRRPGCAELSGTAALLELARIFRSRDAADPALPGQRRLIGRDLRKTLVLVSTSGGSGGAAGARAWARAQDPADDRRRCSCSATSPPSASRGRGWCRGRTAATRPPIAWRRTVESAVRTEVGVDPGGTRAAAQWARRALPLTVSEQGEVDRAGLPAVLSAGHGRARPAAAARRRRARAARRASAARALRAVTALDEARRRGAASGETQPPFAGETSGIVTLRNVLPDWSVRLLVALLPAARRCWPRSTRCSARAAAGSPSGRWLLWIGCAALPALLAWAWLRVLGMTGALPAPPAPVLPAALPLAGAGGGRARQHRARRGARRAGRARGRARVVRGARATRRPGPRARRRARSPAASRCWSGSATRTRPRCSCRPRTCGCWPRCRSRACAARPAGSPSRAGLVAPPLVLAYEMYALGLGPAALARLWLIATAGGHVSRLARGRASALARRLRGRSSRACCARASGSPPPRRRSSCSRAARRSYAGPGSLGGTESALRR